MPLLDDWHRLACQEIDSRRLTSIAFLSTPDIQRVLLDATDGGDVLEGTTVLKDLDLSYDAILQVKISTIGSDEISMSKYADNWFLV